MRREDIEEGVDYALRIGRDPYSPKVRCTVMDLDCVFEERSRMRSDLLSLSARTGRMRRAIRVHVVKGDYQPWGAFGLVQIRQGREGLVVAQHFLCTWAEHEDRERLRRGLADEARTLREEQSVICAELAERLEMAGIDAGELSPLRAKEGHVSVRLGALVKLVEMASV